MATSLPTLPPTLKMTCYELTRFQLVRRENAYYDGPGRLWDCALHADAAARDPACSQLSRAESEVWQFLEATAEAYQQKGSGQ